MTTTVTRIGQAAIDQAEEDETTLRRGTAPRVRGAIAVIVSRFPRIEEPVVLREIDALERQGQPVVLVPLHRERGKVIHEEAKSWLRRALYTHPLSLPTLLANLRFLIRHPRRYLGLLLRVIGGTLLDPSVMIRTLGLFPQAVYLARELPRRGVRHVHAHFATHPATAAWIISQLSNVSFSFTVHGPDVFVHRLLMREKIAAAKFVRTVSTFNQAFLTGLFPIVSEEKIETLHTGVNPEVYAKATAAGHHRHERPSIFSVGRLTDTKAYPLLIDAVGQLKRAGMPVDCTIAGDGPLRIDVEEAIRQYDVADCVRVLGPTPQHEVARLLGEADVFVLPSVIAYTGEMDGVPVALMEAMAAGVPVIAAPISGIPELVEHGRGGFLVDVTQTAHIAQAIRQLIEDPELRARMGREGQEKVARAFDVRRTSARLVEMFQRHEHPDAPAVEQLRVLDWASVGAQAIGIRRIDRQPLSLNAEVTMTDGVHKRDVIVRKKQGGGRAADEFDIMSRIRERLEATSESAEVRYTIPKPLMVDERHDALVRERAPGRRLVAMFRETRNGAVPRRRLATPLRRAGTWLRLMQQATRCDDDGRHVLTALVVLALRDLELAAVADSTIRRHSADIAARLRQYEGELAGQELPVVGQHGRFSAENIFMSDRRIDVVDFEVFREGLVLEDVAHFLVDLSTHFVNPLAARHLPSLERAFLEGFGAPELQHERALRFFMVIKALQLLARGGAGERDRWKQAWRRRGLRQVVLRGIA